MLTPIVLRHVCLFLTPAEMKKVLWVTEATNQLGTFQYLKDNFWVERAEALHNLRGLSIDDSLIVELSMNHRGCELRHLLLDVCDGMGSLGLLEVLLRDPRVDPSTGGNCAIRYASRNGYLPIVERLLQDSRVDPGDKDNCAIRWAALKGHVAVVERLLLDLRVSPNADDDYAICWAAVNGHVAIVERLLQDPRVNPSANDNKAIRWASRNGHAAVVNRLLQDPRVRP